MLRRTVLAVLLSAGLAGVASAQSGWPDRPVRLIVPFAQGTALDLVARMMAEGLTEELKTPVLVDNRLGASGVIGTDAVAKSAPDGYTLLFTSPAHYLNQHVFKSIPYDPVKDFRPVTKISNAQLVLVAGKGAPFSSAKEVIDQAKARPNALRYSSAGLGSTTQLSSALFNAMAGVQIEHIPYKSGTQALTDVLGGHVDMTFTAVATALPYAKQGTLKLLGVSGLQRSRSMPDVPTIAEAAVPGYELVSWSGALAPRATPDAIVARLDAAMVKVAQRPEFQARLVSIGVEPDLLPTPAFERQVAAELPKWQRVAEVSGAMEK